MQRPHVTDNLPDLGVAQLYPGWHALTPISIYKQPVQVADCGLLLHAWAAQRGALLRAIRIFAVAMRAMIEEYPATCGDRISLLSIRIRSLSVAGWDVLQPSAIGNCECGQ